MMPIGDVFQQWIVLLNHKIWKIITSIVMILFLILFISFIVFYFCIYISCLKEGSFNQQINCTINKIQTNYIFGDNQLDKKCQLMIGECFNFNQTRNITLYSTWCDYEISFHQCTIDPSLNSQEENFFKNQTFISVYWSSDFTYGYLKKISKLEINTAKIILYLLIIILILISILLVILTFILHLSDKYERTIHPKPSIVIQKAPKPTEDEYNQNLPPRNSESLSSQRLAIPADGLVPFRSSQSLGRKTLEPLNITVPSWTIARSQHDNDIVFMQNTNI